jgi:hypothetical protein
MPARLHPLMQDADDLDDAGFDGAVEDHVHRIADRRLAALVAAVADMQLRSPAKSSLRSTVDSPCGSAAIRRSVAVSSPR